jgi:hypothetical protein
MVDTTPETRFTTIGVPRRLEKYPNALRGRAVVPRDRLGAVGSDQPGHGRGEQSEITPIAAISARTVPAPVSTTPELVRWPP